MPTNWLPSKAYAYQPGTGTTTQMPSPVFDAAYKRLMEEQKQRSAGREKIMVPNDPNGSFYYKDAPGTILPGRTGAENAYYNQVNAEPKPFNPMQYFDPVEAQKYFTPPGSSEKPVFSISSSYQAGTSPEAIAVWEAKMRGVENDVMAGQAPATSTPATVASTPAASPTATPKSVVPTAPSYNFSPPTNPADALSGVSNNNSPMQQQNTSYTGPAGGTRKKQFANKWFGKQQFL